MRAAQLFDVSGRIVFVTGAASGLGLAYSEVLAENGAHVVMTDIDAPALAERASTLGAAGYAVETIVLDVAQTAALREAIASTAKRHGRLDVVFANAGISAGTGPFTEAGAILNVSLDKWREVVEINLTSIFATIQAAARPMIEQRGGRIIVTSSIGGMKSEPMVGYAYAATKAGLNNLIRHAAVELAQYNVLGELDGRVPDQVVQAGLGCCVGIADHRFGLHPADRRRHDDPPPALFDHRPGRGLDRGEDAREIDLDDLAPLVEGDVEDCAGLGERAGPGGDPRIGEDHVEAAVPFRGRGDRLAQRCGLRDVEDDRFDRIPGGAEGGGPLGERRCVDVRHDDVGAVLGQDLAVGEAQTAGRTGDEDDPPAHVEKLRCSHRRSSSSRLFTGCVRISAETSGSGRDATGEAGRDLRKTRPGSDRRYPQWLKPVPSTFRGWWMNRGSADFTSG